MFERGEPRLFALPPGCDFSRSFLDGLIRRLDQTRPDQIARVEVFVNTQRMARRLKEMLLAGPPTLLPRLRVLGDLARDPLIAGDIPKPVSALRRSLELSRAVSALLDKEPDLAPKTAMFDLAQSLSALMGEMHFEGIGIDRLTDPSLAGDHSAHWDRSLSFLRILAPYFEDVSEPDADARLRMIVDRLTVDWRANPPEHPIIVAGSTGSRGATAEFMQLVSTLPQGAVVLPGFDFDLPAHVWETFADPMASADHPQAGLAKLLRRFKVANSEVLLWHDSAPKNPSRNRVVSLSLRPAPVTDEWLVEGPNLTDLSGATEKMTLVEAATQRDEALVIALMLRQAAEDGRRATLISPDRMLTRQVTASLSRWGILPDDSAGRPLPLTPPGVFLRLIGNVFGQTLTSEALLGILKHPLTHSGGGRGQHLLLTRDLELGLLRGGPPFIHFQDLRKWAGKRADAEAALVWVQWLEQSFEQSEFYGPRPLSDIISQHQALAETLSRGASADADEGELWRKEAGEKAYEVFRDLADNADAAGDVTALEYAAILRSVLGQAEARESLIAHPNITIWGTLEARVEGADLTILGGLNEGVWPGLPNPDPWLNRTMRRDIGLPLPERQIGLSAHDFQQAIAGEQVVLTRALRQGDAPSVASRWLIRLTNLMSGLGDVGQTALSDMRSRGQVWLKMARQLEEPAAPTMPERRPAPKPPKAAHPRRLSVTRIRTLIRDPYAIYAQYILGLRRLDPLRREADAMLRGQAIHKVLEQFIKSTMPDLPDRPSALLEQTARDVFSEDVPWPATRRLWQARIGRISEAFVQDEEKRRVAGLPVALEAEGARDFAVDDFQLTGTADRIDRQPDGDLIIYDYKSGSPPTPAQVKEFDKQLLLEAAIAEVGGFTKLPAAAVARLEYIGLGSSPKSSAIDVTGDLIAETWSGLEGLIAAYRQGQVGYASRSRLARHTDVGDYDHLARYGEWEDDDPTRSEVIT